MTNKISLIFYISFFLKLILAIITPLSLDEMYYWLWGQFPQLSYFDHPPMVGWLMMVGDLFTPLSEGALRWPFVLISHASLWLWYKMLKPVVSEKHLVWWLLVALLNPLWGLGGIIATPDIPVILFWTLSFTISQKIIFKPSPMNYSLLGVFLGLGFLSKYMIVLFPLCLIPWFYKDRLFQYLFTRKALLTLFFGFLFCSPVLLWNYQNEFASLSFQWKHGTQSSSWQWSWSLEYFFGQFFLIFPLFFLLVFKSRSLSNQFFFFATIPLGFFMFTSLFSRVEANWPIIAYPAVYAASFLNIGRYINSIKAVVALWSSLLLLLVIFLFFGFPQFINKNNLKIFESNNFAQVYEFSKDKKNIVADSYQMAAYLSFMKRDLVCKLSHVEGRIDFFNYLDECQQLADQFYIITKNLNLPSVQSKLPEHKILKQFKIDKNFSAYEVVGK